MILWLVSLSTFYQKILHNFLFRMMNIHQREHCCQFPTMMSIVIGRLDDHLPQRQSKCLTFGIGVADSLQKRSLRLPSNESTHVFFNIFPGLAKRGGARKIFWVEKSAFFALPALGPHTF